MMRATLTFLALSLALTTSAQAQSLPAEIGGLENCLFVASNSSWKSYPDEWLCPDGKKLYAVYDIFSSQWVWGNSSNAQCRFHDATKKWLCPPEYKVVPSIQPIDVAKKP